MSITFIKPPFNVLFFNKKGEINPQWQQFFLKWQQQITTNFAPDDATYITRSANLNLSNEFSLGTLTNGLLKVTVAAAIGTPSTATPGTDYTALAFKTIQVATQSDVVADSAADTLTLAAGSGVTITTTPASDTVTFSATGTGGTVTTTGSPASGNLSKFSGATSITNGDLSGDVTTTGTLAATIANLAVTTAKINTAAVTFAKMQNIATQTLIGRDTAGTGDPESVTITQALDWLGT